MKRLNYLLAVAALASPFYVFAEDAAPATFCRFVPERADDFAWENDKIAFRAYGPALRKGAEDSGIDCWLKRVEYPIIDKWYREAKEGKSYHKDHGEGSDPYHVGSSRGCGGLGLWDNEQLVISDTYTEWEIIQCEPDESVFVLTYEYTVGEDTYKEEKQISIKMGERLFHAQSTFWKNGDLAPGLPVAIGITTHNGKANASSDVSKGWMACWETIEGFGLGTGVVMDPSAITEYKLIESKKKDESHALFITKTDAMGQVKYRAGYGWERAGEIKSSKDWNTYLDAFGTANERK
jgi:hypothetical protein